MKQELIKFLEIGKLEKGLFRIWIILATIFYFFGYTGIFTDSDYKDYKEFSKLNASCATSKLFENKLPNLKKGSFLMIKTTEAKDGIRIILRDEYELLLRSPTYKQVYTNTDGGYKKYDLFRSKEMCEDFINRDRDDFFLLLFIVTLSPICVILLWFLLKKTYLWVFRGFK